MVEPIAKEPAAGWAAVDGIAVGRAVVWGGDPPPTPVVGSVVHEHRRLVSALARAIEGLVELQRLLPRAEAELFEPEMAILAELGPSMLVRVDAGMRPEDVVNEATAQGPTDLLGDARARLLDGLASGERSIESLLKGREGDRVLVTSMLTPSVVASLPARVVGIVAAIMQGGGSGYTSHAAILARARDIPLAFVQPDVVRGVRSDDWVVLDTTLTLASVWVEPSKGVVTQAHARREKWVRNRADDEASVAAPLLHLGIEVHVNVDSLYEHVPAAAEGIGLVRTEFVFSRHWSAPSEAEQFGALCAIAARAPNVPLVVRLFDGGGDKPLPWLRAPQGSQARGMELLFMHPSLLEAQLRAIARSAERMRLRALLPLVGSASDVEQVRRRVGEVGVGAMIETPDAVDRIDDIATASDFVSIGTNDLFAIVTGQSRSDSTLSLDRRVLRMIEKVCRRAHSRSRKVSVCGEMASDPHSARILVGLGVDVLSVSPGRFAKVKRSLRDVSINDCRDVAGQALR
jgi:phosphocarrier protein FPr